MAVFLLRRKYDQVCARTAEVQSSFLGIETYILYVRVYNQGDAADSSVEKWLFYVSLWILHLCMNRLRIEIRKKVSNEPPPRPQQDILEVMSFIDRNGFYCLLLSYFSSFHYGVVFIVWRLLLNATVLLPNVYDHLWLGKQRYGNS